jgi:hypothetical protein
MGNIISIETGFKPSINLPSANDVYLATKKNQDESLKLDRQIRDLSTSREQYYKLQEIQSLAYEECKARVLFAMISGNTSTVCQNIGGKNEYRLRELGYNLYQFPMSDDDNSAASMFFRLQVTWDPKMPD